MPTTKSDTFVNRVPVVPGLVSVSLWSTDLFFPGLQAAQPAEPLPPVGAPGDDLPAEDLPTEDLPAEPAPEPLPAEDAGFALVTAAEDDGAVAELVHADGCAADAAPATYPLPAPRAVGPLDYDPEAWLASAEAAGWVPVWLGEAFRAGEVGSPRDFWRCQVRMRTERVRGFFGDRPIPEALLADSKRKKKGRGPADRPKAQTPPPPRRVEPQRREEPTDRRADAGTAGFLSAAGAADGYPRASYGRSRRELRAEFPVLDPADTPTLVAAGWVYFAGPAGPGTASVWAAPDEGGTERLGTVGTTGLLVVGFDPWQADAKNPCGRLTAVLHTLEWDAHARKLGLGRRWVKDVLSGAVGGKPRAGEFDAERDREMIRASLILAHQLVGAVAVPQAAAEVVGPLPLPRARVILDTLPDWAPTLALAKYGDQPVVDLADVPADFPFDVGSVLLEIDAPGFDVRVAPERRHPGPVPGTARWAVVPDAGGVTRFRPVGLPAWLDLGYSL